MLHFIIGTKAQFIKMAPVMTAARDQGLPHSVIDLSQHGALTGQIMTAFGLKPEIRKPIAWQGSVESYADALRWSWKIFSLLLRSRHTVRKRLGADPGDIALIHGDTLSTLFGALLARRAGLKTGLVEAGLTSHHLFDPFPEELIRRAAERRANFLFAPGSEAATALQDRGLHGQVIDTFYNTGRDALMMMLPDRTGKASDSTSRYSVCTLHRLETISRKQRLRVMVDYIADLAPHLGTIRFVMHEPTRRALIRHGLLDRLAMIPGIEITALCGYPEFMKLLAGARCILTDGGSVQEEASYLGKPCLILRSHTERPHGLGTSARLARMDPAEDARFLLENTQSPITKIPAMTASRCIIETLSAARTENAGSIR